MEYRAQICDRVLIGADSVIGGFVCDGAIVGVSCIMLGSLVHDACHPDLPWGQFEPHPTLRDGAFVGCGAVIVGDVTVGAGAYVAANATITKNVPGDHVALGTNQFVPIDQWRGASLDRKRWSVGITVPQGPSRVDRRTIDRTCTSTEP